MPLSIPFSMSSSRPPDATITANVSTDGSRAERRRCVTRELTAAGLKRSTEEPLAPLAPRAPHSGFRAGMAEKSSGSHSLCPEITAFLKQTNKSERGQVNASPFRFQSTPSSDFSSRGRGVWKKLFRKRGIVGNVVAPCCGVGVEIKRLDV